MDPDAAADSDDSTDTIIVSRERLAHWRSQLSDPAASPCSRSSAGGGLPAATADAAPNSAGSEESASALRFTQARAGDQRPAADPSHAVRSGGFRDLFERMKVRNAGERTDGSRPPGGGDVGHGGRTPDASRNCTKSDSGGGRTQIAEPAAGSSGARSPVKVESKRKVRDGDARSQGAHRKAASVKSRNVSGNVRKLPESPLDDGSKYVSHPAETPRARMDIRDIFSADRERVAIPRNRNTSESSHASSASTKSTGKSSSAAKRSDRRHGSVSSRISGSSRESSPSDGWSRTAGSSDRRRKPAETSGDAHRGQSGTSPDKPAKRQNAGEAELGSGQGGEKKKQQTAAGSNSKKDTTSPKTAEKSRLKPGKMSKPISSKLTDALKKLATGKDGGGAPLRKKSCHSKSAHTERTGEEVGPAMESRDGKTSQKRPAPTASKEKTSAADKGGKTDQSNTSCSSTGSNRAPKPTAGKVSREMVDGKGVSARTPVSASAKIKTDKPAKTADHLGQSGKRGNVNCKPRSKANRSKGTDSKGGLNAECEVGKSKISRPTEEEMKKKIVDDIARGTSFIPVIERSMIDDCNCSRPTGVERDVDSVNREHIECDSPHKKSCMESPQPERIVRDTNHNTVSPSFDKAPEGQSVESHGPPTASVGARCETDFKAELDYSDLDDMSSGEEFENDGFNDFLEDIIGDINAGKFSDLKDECEITLPFAFAQNRVVVKREPPSPSVAIGTDLSHPDSEIPAPSDAHAPVTEALDRDLFPSEGPALSKDPAVIQEESEQNRTSDEDSRDSSLPVGSPLPEGVGERATHVPPSGDPGEEAARQHCLPGDDSTMTESQLNLANESVGKSAGEKREEVPSLPVERSGKSPVFQRLKNVSEESAPSITCAQNDGIAKDDNVDQAGGDIDGGSIYVPNLELKKNMCKDTQTCEFLFAQKSPAVSRTENHDVQMQTEETPKIEVEKTSVETQTKPIPAGYNTNLEAQTEPVTKPKAGRRSVRMQTVKVSHRDKGTGTVALRMVSASAQTVGRSSGKAPPTSSDRCVQTETEAAAPQSTVRRVPLLNVNAATESSDRDAAVVNSFCESIFWQLENFSNRVLAPVGDVKSGKAADKAKEARELLNKRHGKSFADQLSMCGAAVRKTLASMEAIMKVNRDKERQAKLKLTDSGSESIEVQLSNQAKRKRHKSREANVGTRKSSKSDDRENKVCARALSDVGSSTLNAELPPSSTTSPESAAQPKTKQMGDTLWDVATMPEEWRTVLEEGYGRDYLRALCRRDQLNALYNRAVQRLNANAYLVANAKPHLVPPRAEDQADSEDALRTWRTFCVPNGMFTGLGGQLSGLAHLQSEQLPLNPFSINGRVDVSAWSESERAESESDTKRKRKSTDSDHSSGSETKRTCRSGGPDVSARLLPDSGFGIAGSRLEIPESGRAPVSRDGRGQTNTPAFRASPTPTVELPRDCEVWDEQCQQFLERIGTVVRPRRRSGAAGCVESRRPSTVVHELSRLSSAAAERVDVPSSRADLPPSVTVPQCGTNASAVVPPPSKDAITVNSIPLPPPPPLPELPELPELLDAVETRTYDAPPDTSAPPPWPSSVSCLTDEDDISASESEPNADMSFPPTPFDKRVLVSVTLSSLSPLVSVPVQTQPPAVSERVLITVPICTSSPRVCQPGETSVKPAETGVPHGEENSVSQTEAAEQKAAAAAGGDFGSETIEPPRPDSTISASSDMSLSSMLSPQLEPIQPEAEQEEAEDTALVQEEPVCDVQVSTRQTTVIDQGKRYSGEVERERCGEATSQGKTVSADPGQSDRVGTERGVSEGKHSELTKEGHLEPLSDRTAGNVSSLQTPPIEKIVNMISARTPSGQRSRADRGEEPESEQQQRSGTSTPQSLPPKPGVKYTIFVYRGGSAAPQSSTGPAPDQVIAAGRRLLNSPKVESPKRRRCWKDPEEGELETNAEREGDEESGAKRLRSNSGDDVQRKRTPSSLSADETDTAQPQKGTNSPGQNSRLARSLSLLNSQKSQPKRRVASRSRSPPRAYSIRVAPPEDPVSPRPRFSTRPEGKDNRSRRDSPSDRRPMARRSSPHRSPSSREGRSPRSGDRWVATNRWSRVRSEEHRESSPHAASVSRSRSVANHKNRSSAKRSSSRGEDEAGSLGTKSSSGSSDDVRLPAAKGGEHRVSGTADIVTPEPGEIIDEQRGRHVASKKQGADTGQRTGPERTTYSANTEEQTTAKPPAKGPESGEIPGGRIELDSLHRGPATTGAITEESSEENLPPSGSKTDRQAPGQTTQEDPKYNCVTAGCEKQKGETEGDSETREEDTVSPETNVLVQASVQIATRSPTSGQSCTDEKERDAVCEDQCGYLVGQQELNENAEPSEPTAGPAQKDELDPTSPKKDQRQSSPRVEVNVLNGVESDVSNNSGATNPPVSDERQDDPRAENAEKQLKAAPESAEQHSCALLEKEVVELEPNDKSSHTAATPALPGADKVNSLEALSRDKSPATNELSNLTKPEAIAAEKASEIADKTARAEARPGADATEESAASFPTDCTPRGAGEAAGAGASSTEESSAPFDNDLSLASPGQCDDKGRSSADTDVPASNTGLENAALKDSSLAENKQTASGPDETDAGTDEGSGSPSAVPAVSPGAEGTATEPEDGTCADGTTTATPAAKSIAEDVEAGGSSTPVSETAPITPPKDRGDVSIVQDTLHQQSAVSSEDSPDTAEFRVRVEDEDCSRELSEDDDICEVTPEEPLMASSPTANASEAAPGVAKPCGVEKERSAMYQCNKCSRKVANVFAHAKFCKGTCEIMTAPAAETSASSHKSDWSPANGSGASAGSEGKSRVNTPNSQFDFRCNKCRLSFRDLSSHDSSCKGVCTRTCRVCRKKTALSMKDHARQCLGPLCFVCGKYGRHLCRTKGGLRKFRGDARVCRLCGFGVFGLHYCKVQIKAQKMGKTHCDGCGKWLAQCSCFFESLKWCQSLPEKPKNSPVRRPRPLNRLVCRDCGGWGHGSCAYFSGEVRTVRWNREYFR